MHERKALMAAHSDAFLALPGGYGTLEEFFEAITWGQLGYHGKAYAQSLNVAGYFDSLLRFCDDATSVSASFARATRALLLAGSDLEALLDEAVGPRNSA
jgi:uncharacterized protein (TIGR00730 family)